MTKTQIKIIFYSIVSLLIIFAGLWFYLNKMTVQNSDINVMKIEDKDKVYSYSIFSDFYYHITEYDEDGAERSQFSQLIPTETKIGYDFLKNSKGLVLNSIKKNNTITLSDKNGNTVSDNIEILQNFSKEFGKIVATQDQHYFTKAVDNINDVMSGLYKSKSPLSKISINNYYEDIIETPIENLTIKPFKLDNLTSNIKDFFVAPINSWHPNIVEWQFAEKDRIYFQYLKHLNSTTIDSYLENSNDKKNVTIVKTIKINNNKIQKFFFKIRNNENKIESLFMDENGYMYILIYQAQNAKSFKKYLHDYLKISFGISFSDTVAFDNTFAKKQEKLELENSKYNKIINEIKELDKKLISMKLLNHFDLKANVNPDMGSFKFDERYKEFHKIYDTYHIIKVVEEELYSKKLILEASKHYNSISSKFKSIFKENIKLENICSSIPCIEKLKSNNWRDNDENN